MPELRKRKALEAAASPAIKKANSIKAAGPKSPAADRASPGGEISVGDIIPIDGFGGEIETHEGERVTLKSLVEESQSGVVLFTYPRASTPGCMLSVNI